MEPNEITADEVIELSHALGFDTDDVVELARQVDSYQRRTDSGKVVTVRGYTRTSNSAVADRAKSGRPSLAANAGRFPGDRSIPVWPDAGKGVEKKEVKESPKYEGMEDSGQVDQAVLDKEVPVMLEVLANQPKNKALKELTDILKTLTSVQLTSDPSFDPDIIELARGIVRITGYSYVSKKTGKVIRVNPYTQIRSLINAMGGPAMAARKGITPDLMDRALPGYQIKGKVFKEMPKATAARRVAGKMSDANALKKLNEIRVDRSFEVNKPKPGDDYMKKAMSAIHPLASVRNSLEGSKVRVGNSLWTRGMDGLWYKQPRRNGNGLSDRDITKAIASKGGFVELLQGNPVKRKDFGFESKVDFDKINPNSKHRSVAVLHTQALEPSFRNMPEGLADSISGNLEVRSPSNKASKDAKSLTHTSVTKTNGYYPKLVVNPDPKIQADVIRNLPKQQAEGYSVPSTLHPLEANMARETSVFTEKLLASRAPEAMTERMYDRLSKAYDKNVTSDFGDYSELSGKDGWLARLTGERSEALKKELGTSLSMSSLRSPEEFLAEAWTEYVGNPEPRSLSRDLGEAYQATMVEFSDYLFKSGWVDATEIPEKTYTKTTSKSVSRKISDAIDGDSDRVIETNLAPRDLRSVLNHSSKYVDIRDVDGNPTFDAEIQRNGNSVTISALVYPQTDPKTLPTGIPHVTPAPVEPGAKYIQTPVEELAKGPDNQRRYAAFIDQGKALKAIEAIEEVMYSEGVRRFEANIRPGEDSILYARAGYQFDPNNTDVHELSMMLGDVSTLMDAVSVDNKDMFWAVPPHVQRAVKSKLRKWEREMTADPSTWPTPQEIASLGKLREDEMSIGEAILDRHAWNGVKRIDGSKFEPWSELPHQIDTGYDVEAQRPDMSTLVNPNMPSASALNGVSRVVDANLQSPVVSSDELVNATKATAKLRAGFEGSWSDQISFDAFMSMDKEARKSFLKKGVGKPSSPALKTAMTDLANDVISRHDFKEPKITVTGPFENHTITVKDGKDLMFSLTVKKNADTGELEWVGPRHGQDNLKAALFSFDMVDSLENSYYNSNVHSVWKYPKKDDPVASYILASTGYTWNNPPSMQELRKVFDAELVSQELRARDIFTREAEVLNRGKSTSSLLKVQAAVDKKVENFINDLRLQVDGYMNAYDETNGGPPHPFVLAQIGKDQERQLKKAQSILPPVMPAALAANATAAEKKAHAEAMRKYEAAVDRMKSREGTAFQQMLSIDGDALNDNFAEFLGKQVLTGGLYGWYKSMGGWWGWATDSYNPSARKSSVGLLYMLLRFLPASFLRGGLMMTATALLKKTSSPRPEDWPTPQEISDIIGKIENQVPDSVLAQVRSQMNGN